MLILGLKGLKHSTTRFSSFTYQSAFVAHREISHCREVASGRGWT